MKFKPDWPDARARLTAMWEGRPLDRPCISVLAPSGRSVHAPLPRDANQKWMDLNWVVNDALALCQNTHWGGEAIPSYRVLAGRAVAFGAKPVFAMDAIGHEPVKGDLGKPPAIKLNWGDPWIARSDAVYLAMADAAGADNFMLGHPCILPASDLLPALLGPETFLTAAAEHPEWVNAAFGQLLDHSMAARMRLHAFVAPRRCIVNGQGGPMIFWAPEPYQPMQSDISSVLSPEMYERYVVPELERCGREIGAVWYHLDGREAKQHLPRLLSLGYVRVIESTATPGEPGEPENGPGHLELYKQVQAAGKIVHIAVPSKHVEALTKALDPRLLMMETWVGSAGEADELLASARRWTRGV